MFGCQRVDDSISLRSHLFNDLNKIHRNRLSCMKCCAWDLKADQLKGLKNVAWVINFHLIRDTFKAFKASNQRNYIGKSSLICRCWTDFLNRLVWIMGQGQQWIEMTWNRTEFDTQTFQFSTKLVSIFSTSSPVSFLISNFKRNSNSNSEASRLIS